VRLVRPLLFHTRLKSIPVSGQALRCANTRYCGSAARLARISHGSMQA
jgi:hypothetical protein